MEEFCDGFGLGDVGRDAEHVTFGGFGLDADFGLLKGLGISAGEDDGSRSCTGKMDGGMLKHVSRSVRVKEDVDEMRPFGKVSSYFSNARSSSRNENGLSYSCILGASGGRDEVVDIMSRWLD